MMMG